MKTHNDGVELVRGEFDNCAAIQPVLKLCPNIEASSKDDSLGAFLLAVAKIMVESDFEGERETKRTTD